MSRQYRHLAYVAELTSDVQHVAGQDNLVADALSRPPVAVLVPPTSSPGSSASSNLEGLAARQRGCAETQHARASSSLQVLEYKLHGVQLLCDFSTDRPRPLLYFLKRIGDRFLRLSMVHHILVSGLPGI
jgi:hypothetical protein